MIKYGNGFVISSYTSLAWLTIHDGFLKLIYVSKGVPDTGYRVWKDIKHFTRRFVNKMTGILRKAPRVHLNFTLICVLS